MLLTQTNSSYLPGLLFHEDKPARESRERFNLESRNSGGAGTRYGHHSNKVNSFTSFGHGDGDPLKENSIAHKSISKAQQSNADELDNKKLKSPEHSFKGANIGALLKTPLDIKLLRGTGFSKDGKQSDNEEEPFSGSPEFLQKHSYGSTIIVAPARNSEKFITLYKN